MNKVNLRELADELDSMSDEWSYFVDRTTCELISADTYHLGYAEELEEVPEDLPAWELEAIGEASAIIEKWGNLIRLPDKYEINAYSIMEDYIETVNDPHIRDCLSVAITGRGAFRRFKDTADRFGVIDKWYAFKDEALIAFAKKWCEANDLPYSLEDPFRR